DIGIHATDQSRVAHLALAISVMCRQTGILPRMRRFIGVTGELRLEMRLAERVRLEIVWRMRSVKRNQEVERIVLRLLEEFERAIGHQVCLEASELMASAVADELRIAIRASTARNGMPIRKSSLRAVVIPHVPFSAHTELITVAGQDFGVGGMAVQKTDRGR